MEEVVETAKNSDFTHDDSNDVTILSNENDHVLLCSGKRFRSWEECEGFISAWANQQGFRVIKDRVLRDGEVIWRRSYICSHGRTYESNSTKDTATKKNWLPEMWESWPLSKELQGIRSITITFGGTICWERPYPRPPVQINLPEIQYDLPLITFKMLRLKTRVFVF
ncbi:unnamed protein product [Rhizophagus irregularis]|nr:unnamed protein product [Rhizophagus irregularis]